MKIRILILLSCSILLNSCRTYLDIGTKDIKTDYMTLKYLEDHNELNYFNKVNASADDQKFYTTHFSVDLPKQIVYWKQLGNEFYFEYDFKQVIYLYTAYKNKGKESDNWEEKDISDLNELKDELEGYWVKERNYDINYLEKKREGRSSKLYTNGKYKIVLYNIKEENFQKYHELTKTFRVQ